MNALALRPTGDYAESLARIKANAFTANDIRLLHARERYAFLAGVVQARDAWTLIDIGCGYAANLEAVARRYPSLYIVGVDVDPDVIEANREQHPGIRFVQGGIDSILFNASGGIASCFEAIGHENIPDDVALLKAMKAIVPGGVCVLSIGRFETDAEHVPHWYFKRSYGAKDFVDLWRQAGFTDVCWYGQTYPTKRKDVISIEPIWPCAEDFGVADFMLGVGRA